MPSYFVYCLIDPRTEEIRYIGKTVATLPMRLSQHIYAATHNKWQSHVNNWIRSLLHGGDRPVIRVLSVVSDKETLSREECRLIEYYRKRGARLTNLTNGGDGAPGRVLSDASIKKMRQAHLGNPGYWTGKKRDPETGRKISEANKGRIAWNKGIPMSEDQKLKVSIARKGKCIGNKNAVGNRGNKRPQDVCAKISAALKGRSGRKQSDEVRAKISEGMRQYRAKLAQSENV
jgi:hypothetical protein